MNTYGSNNIEITYEGQSIMVSEEMAAVLSNSVKSEHAQNRKIRRYHSTNCMSDNIVAKLRDHNSPALFETVTKKMDIHQLHDALLNVGLTDKQYHRLVLYYFEGLTYREIGIIEGVCFTKIVKSVKGAEKKIMKYIQTKDKKSF